MIHRACGGDRWRFLLATCFTLLNAAFFIHAFAGLETLLYFVLVLHVMTTPRERLTTSGNAWLILLAPLVRPEGALISLYLLHLIFVTAPTSPERQAARRVALLAIAAGGLYFAARYTYFGQLLPNTFYVKGGAGPGKLLYNLYIERSYLLMLLLAYGWLVYRKADLLFPTLQLTGYALVNLTADLQMNYASRFSFQAAFPLIVHAFILLTASLERTRSRVVLPIALALSSLLLVNPKEIGRLLTWYPYGLQSHAALGHALEPLREAGYVMAVGDAGITPYLSGWHTVDYIGLANRSIARSIHDGTQPVFPRPDLILMYGNTPDCSTRSMRFKGAEAFFREIVPDDYTCVPGPRWSDYYYLHGMIRKDNPDRARIATIFRQTRENAARYGDREALRDILSFRTVLRLY